MRSRRATAYPAPRRYHITRCDPYDSDTEAGEGVLFDLSPAGCRMRSDIALNAGTYLALRMQWRRNQPPWPWKSRSFAGAKTGTSEWSVCSIVRETVNESQILSSRCYRTKCLPILRTHVDAHRRRPLTRLS